MALTEKSNELLEALCRAECLGLLPHLMHVERRAERETVSVTSSDGLGQLVDRRLHVNYCVYISKLNII